MSAPTSRPNVLFVEDDNALRTLLIEELSDEFDMQGAANGEDALLMILRRPPDLVVTDLVMPMLSGVELVRILRERPSTAGIPVLMISGRAAYEVGDGFEVGADSYLSKPYTPEQLRSRIWAMLRRTEFRTERARREERALVEQRAIAEKAALLESVTDPFYAMDWQWRVTYANQRAVDYFQIPRERMLGHVIWDLIPQSNDSQLKREFERAAQERRSRMFEVQSPLTGRWLEISCYPHAEGIAVNFRDITARKESEDALRQRERQLSELTTELEQRVERSLAERSRAIEQLAQAQKMETIGQLTGGVAHDFNNLLTPIVGALDVLRRRDTGDERAQRLTSGALQAADRARTLIQRLLAFARRQHLQAQPVDVPKLMRGMVDLLARTLGPQIELSINAPNDLPAAMVDAHQLELALLNLAVNARDAMPRGGTLTFSIQRGSESSLTIEVRDSGEGMEPEVLERAIEPFFTTKEAGRGTGLGLSMVHGLAAQSGGDFTLTSAPGRGTTATLKLPLASEAPPRDEHFESSVLPAVTARARVLLVDDEALVRLGTVAMLESGGLRVTEAPSAERALELLRGGLDVQLVITDFAMPGVNGVQLAREIRALRGDLPILMITGYAALPDAETGGLPRLDKPFGQDELLERVALLLRDTAVGSKGA